MTTAPTAPRRHRALLQLLSLFAATALTLAACGTDDDADPGDMPGGDTSITDADASGGDTTAGDTPEGDADTAEPVDPLVAVPPAPLEGDLAACPAGFEAGFTSGQHEGFEVAGQQRSFLLELPDGADASTPLPLFIGFHGTDGTGQSAFDGWNMQDFVDTGFIVLLPDGEDNGGLWPTWDALHQAGDDQSNNVDLAFVDALIDCVAATHAVDVNRVYAGGHSAGGIMTNHVLRSRSSVFAGGIVASGVYDLTAPDPEVELEPMAVMVTWGGDNDSYGGTTASGVELPMINFVEQAAIASGAYEDAPAVEQFHCAGDMLGHIWLSSINAQLIDFLLNHPLGLTANADWSVETAPQADISCSAEAAVYVPPVVVECVEQESAQCQTYCQFIGDCVVENGTVAGVLGPQLTALGFTGDNKEMCEGCITLCETDETTGAAVDAEILGCFETAQSTAVCGAGAAGAQPFIDAINSCCDGRTDSEICNRLCGTIKENQIAVQLATSCAEF